MKVSIEFLCHFSCDHCDRWFTIADRIPNKGDIIYCPSGHENTVGEVSAAVAYPEGIVVKEFKQ
ncbi:MAG: hypothetical protein AAGD25_06545 [Cyanobacteria bacterium P01_F01_bin.150]